MNARYSALLLLAPLMLLAACEKKEAVATEPDASVATVNGAAVSKSAFELYVANIARQSGREVTAEERAQLLDQFIGMQLAAQAAEKSGIAKDPEVADLLAFARFNVLVDATLQKYLKDHPVTDADLKPEYDLQIAALPRQYRARHILVDDKAAAEAITKQLKKGADFAKLAKQKSKDSSASEGGDLSWFTPDTMVKPFADAVVALQPGQTTEAPVQSQYGWHVIRLEETRAYQAPAFEEVKDKVKMLAQRKKVQSYLDELRKEAKIEKKI